MSAEIQERAPRRDPGPTVCRDLGVVVIGRNEGERLIRCLESVRNQAACVVYVDSGSTDGSVETGRALADAVVELDMRKPFTAARARNAGLERLLEIRAGLVYVFFVDGDCEVVDSWLATAVQFLIEKPEFAIVWGLRRERYPEKSIYNLLCDIEWQDYPLGETGACGGDAVGRLDAIRAVKGFRADLICGEEPEMCFRLRQKGWRIFHLESPMTLHDAAIYRFSQWWTRMMRTGYGFAQGGVLYGAPMMETRRSWFWGLGIPLAGLMLAPFVGWWSAIVLFIYPLQIIRLSLRGNRLSARENWLRAGALVLGKFPEMLGQIKYHLDRLRRAPSRLIEYK
jgi:glycosyltransferase involved in cell wall biosynthesis